MMTSSPGLNPDRLEREQQGVGTGPGSTAGRPQARPARARGPAPRAPRTNRQESSTRAAASISSARRDSCCRLEVDLGDHQKPGTRRGPRVGPIPSRLVWRHGTRSRPRAGSRTRLRMDQQLKRQSIPTRVSQPAVVSMTSHALRCADVGGSSAPSRTLFRLQVLVVGLLVVVDIVPGIGVEPGPLVGADREIGVDVPERRGDGSILQVWLRLSAPFPRAPAAGPVRISLALPS